MNKIEHPIDNGLKMGEIFYLNGSTYILAQYATKYVLVNLATGETFYGLQASPKEAFGEHLNEFTKVTKPFTITPCLN